MTTIRNIALALTFLVAFLAISPPEASAQGCSGSIVFGAVHTDETQQYLWSADDGSGMDIELYGYLSGEWHYLQTTTTVNGGFSFNLVNCIPHRLKPVRPDPPDHIGLFNVKKIDFTISNPNEFHTYYIVYDEP